MKKVKEVKYAAGIPIEIQELMGAEPYRYIQNYTAYNGNHATMAPPPPDPRVVTKFKAFDLIKVPLEDLIKKLQKITQDPSYISAHFDYYAYGTLKLYYETAVEATPQAIEIYEKGIAIYNAEKEIFEKLQKLVKQLNEDKKQAAIKLEIESLEKRLAKLRK